jgi:hypothetical protein
MEAFVLASTALSGLRDDTRRGQVSARPERSGTDEAGRLPVRSDGERYDVRQGGKHTHLGRRERGHAILSDRPERIAGDMKTATFVPFWSKGKDSFLSDPPNADISSLEGDKLQQIVAVLKDPVLQGDSLIYTARFLQGEMPAKRSDVFMLIDIVGMPLTPLSYVGLARRGYRRALYR